MTRIIIYHAARIFLGADFADYTDLFFFTLMVINKERSNYNSSPKLGEVSLATEESVKMQAL